MKNHHEISKILETKRPALTHLSVLKDMQPHTLRELEQKHMNNYHEISKILEIKRPTLTLISVLKDMQPHTLRELEQKLMLRQPDVSNGVNELLKAFPQFFEENVRAVDGKGRPEKIIKMIQPVSKLKEFFITSLTDDFTTKLTKLKDFDFGDVD